MKTLNILSVLICSILGTVAYPQSGQSYHGNPSKVVTPNSNWIYEKTYIDEIGRSIADITYYNGLGWPIEIVNIEASPTFYNISTPISYDSRLRKSTTWLPYMSNKKTAEQDRMGSDWYYRNIYGPGPNPEEPWEEIGSSKTIYKIYHPLDYVEKELPVGYPIFRNNETTYEYGLGGLEVLLWKIDPTNGSVYTAGTHPAGTLQKITVKDGDGKGYITYTDSKGNMLLHSRIHEWIEADDDVMVEYVDTYYVYDDLGRLRWVIPPFSNRPSRLSPGDPAAEGYCYYYSYDARGRQTLKKIPGKAPEYSVYDKADRIVMSQDGRLRDEQRWKIYVYDAFDRLTEVWARRQEELSREDAQLLVTGSATLGGEHILEQYLYGTSVPALPFIPVSGLVTNYDTRIKSLLTYEKKAVIKDAGIGGYDYVETAYYYDHKGQVIQQVVKNHLGGTSRYSYKYDFSGNILTTYEAHALTPSAPVTETKRTDHIYDHRGRMMSEKIYINGQHVTGTSYSYDDLSRLAAKEYDAMPTGARETYCYDIRSYLTAQQSPWFDIELSYENPELGSSPSYTGNITELHWTHKDGVAGNQRQSYGFSYDWEGRLNNSRYYINGISSLQRTEEVGYDDRGNITYLTRFGSYSRENHLYYSYSGNQLTRLTDNVGGGNWYYSYDTNGNMTSDGRQGVELDYNYLNLTNSVTDGNSSEVKARYSWLADGTKLSVSSGDGNDGYEYLGSMAYKRINGELVLESTAFGEGRIYATIGQSANARTAGNAARTANSQGTGPTTPASPTEDLIVPGWVMEPEEPVEPEQPVYPGDPIDPTDPQQPVGPDPVDPIGPVEPDGPGDPIWPGENHGNGYNYQVDYFITDHLGSVRVIVDDSGSAIARYDYYPFGMTWNNPEMPVSPTNRYLYNGKELQEMASLNFLDYGWRMYDSFIGRMNGVDPLSEKRYDLTPYGFVGNNPINNIELDGMDWYSYLEGEEDENGNIHYRRQYVYRQGEAEESLKEKYGFLSEGMTAINKDYYFSLFGEKMERASMDAFYTMQRDGEYLSNPEFSLIDYAGAVSSSLGILSAAGSQLYFSPQFKTWFGKDFKLRSQTWGGNGTTGGKFKFALKQSKWLKGVGYAGTGLSVAHTEWQYRSGFITNQGRWIEHVSDGISTAPLYGTAWAIGWNLGKHYGPSKWFK